MSPNLALHFLGSPQLYLNNTLVTAKRRKAVALLAYLSIERGSHQRALLSNLFWPEYEQPKAFANLRHTLWEVQQAIGEGWIDADREQIRLNEKADIWLDTTHFKSLLGQSYVQQDIPLRISLLADSAKLYRNQFLTGFSLKDAYPFNEWAYIESEDLRLKLVTVLTMISEDYCSLNEAEKAIPYARRLITLNPLNESAHRLLMDIYIQAGQHSAALKQYQFLEQTLRKELNLDPQSETRELYKKIRKGEAKPVPVEKRAEITTTKHNLPHQISSFIGREKEQAEITDLIANNRLVTLLGTGGIGKTSLSLQMGHILLNKCPDGVWFISLDSLSDPALVPQTVASIFNIRESAERPAIDILTDVLREKKALLILDNCEHLLDACAQLATTLLTNCPNIKILATSREVLNITGEAIYQMPSLSLPEQDKVSLEELTEYESVRLFTERATLAVTSFSLTNNNAQAVIEICHKVDGIPLAIELAAARVNILQVEEILYQLNDSFALLISDSRTSSERHQTLQASMDWSWGLLNEEEQIFLKQLSVFAGGWTLESAQAVCDDDVLGLMDSLVKKSLIVVKQVSESKTRYRFHEIIRQYTREKLIKSGEEENIRTRHLKYFEQFAEQAEPAMRGPAQAEWYERFYAELDNIRTAVAWADKTDMEAALYLLSRLSTYWEIFDRRESKHLLTKFLEKSESRAFPRARTKALLSHAWYLFWLDHHEDARLEAEECLQLFRTHQNQEGEVDALLILGLAKFQRADIQQSLNLAKSLNDIWKQAHAYFFLSAIGEVDDYSQRIRYFNTAATYFRKEGDLFSLAKTLNTLAFHQVLNGDFEMAKKSLNEVHLLGGLSNMGAQARGGETAQSIIAFAYGNYKQARAIIEESISIAELSGHQIDYIWNRTRLGYVALQEGNLTEARELFVQTALYFQKDNNVIGVVFTLEGMAGLYVARNNPLKAALLIGWADVVREKINDTRPFIEQADVDKIIAACQAKMGEAAFSDAYDSGGKMTLDEAVAFALGEN